MSRWRPINIGSSASALQKAQPSLKPMKRAFYICLLVIWSLPASAVQCVYVVQKESDVPTLPVAGYDLVFAGTVIALHPVRRNDGKNRWLERTEATFDVEKVWFGSIEPDGSVVISSRFNPIAHDRGFKVGQQGVVLAKQIDGLLVSPACSPPRGPEDEEALIRRIESEYGEHGQEEAAADAGH